MSKDPSRPMASQDSSSGTAAPGLNPGITEDDGDTIQLGEIIGTLLHYKWLIVAITSVALVAGVFTAFTSTPIYRADALLQVEEKSQGLQMLQDLQNPMGDTISISAEQEILRSRMILGRVVDRLNLDLFARPVYAPLVGDALARRHGNDTLADPLLGLNQFAWGGERIQIASLEVPDARRGQALTLVAGNQQTYQLYDAEGRLLLSGRVGESVSGDGISLFISELRAHPGTQFQVGRHTRGAAINQLRGQFEVRERGRGSGVLELTLTGPDRDRLPAKLNEIMDAYVRQNVEHRSAEAENSLKFLESQLPQLKSQLDAAEAAYNNYRQNRGSVDLTMETQSVLKSVVEVENAIFAMQQEREELRQRYTPEHPRVVALDTQINRSRQRRNRLEQEVSQLPETQQTALRLRRDVEVSNQLYTSLLHSAQQLRVARAGTVGDARVIDDAVSTGGPVAPSQNRILLISGLLGLMASGGVIFLIRALRVVVEDPDSIEQKLGIPVYASIPHSKTEARLVRDVRRGRVNGDVLTLVDPEDDAVESLRSLRTTVHFALMDSKQHSLMITGPSMSVGKSFVAKNLAVVLAQSGKSVILVDADLRKGRLHQGFSVPREGGVSEMVSGEINHLGSIVRSTPQKGLSLVTTGKRPPNPSELLMHPRFGELLDQLAVLCEILVVDAPPVLAVSDAAIVGRHVGATLMVVRSGRHPMHEIEQTVKRLNQSGVSVKGAVFNDLDVNRQRYRYGYRGYVYRYQYKN